MDELKDALLDARLRIGRLEGEVDDLRHWVKTLATRLDALEDAAHEETPLKGDGT
jgi:hypothetical protein